jgi:hypothetical protein
LRLITALVFMSTALVQHFFVANESQLNVKVLTRNTVRIVETNQVTICSLHEPIHLLIDTVCCSRLAALSVVRTLRCESTLSVTNITNNNHRTNNRFQITLSARFHYLTLQRSHAPFDVKRLGHNDASEESAELTRRDGEVCFRPIAEFDHSRNTTICVRPSILGSQP